MSSGALSPAKQRRPSEMDRAKRARLRPGRNGGCVSNCFAAKRSLRMKSSNMGTDRPLSRRTDKLPAGNARVIQTAERPQSGRWQTESRFAYQAIHRRERSSAASERTAAWELTRCRPSQRFPATSGAVIGGRSSVSRRSVASA